MKPSNPTAARIHIDIKAQSLALIIADQTAARYAVSCAANGAGERNGSECTPRGAHIIRAKIGDGAPLGGVFIARRPSGEVFRAAMRATAPERDWILTRILWLSGVQPGVNRLGDVDTMRRYIYIHGAPDDIPMGAPGSRGCIRMRNREIVELFNQVPCGAAVQIDA